MEGTKKLVESKGSTAEIALHVANIAVSTVVKEMVAACVDRFGRLDFGINNAGIALGGMKTAEISLSMFDKSCEVNEKGVSCQGLPPSFGAVAIYSTN